METLYSTLSGGLALLAMFAFLLKRITALNNWFWLKCALYVLVLVVVIDLKIQGLSPVEYVDGAISNLSVLTMMGIILYLWSSLVPYNGSPHSPYGYLLPEREKGWVACLILLTAILIYPFSLLSMTAFEPYAWGYNAAWIPSGYLLIGLVALWYDRRYAFMLLVLMLAVLCYCLRVSGSDNFFDYLLDPFLVIWAVIGLMRSLICRCCFFEST